MSLSKLPNGRWRAQCYDSVTKTNISAAKVLGLEVASFRTKAEAKAAREQARAKLKARALDPKAMTVQAWWELWTTHPMFQRPKASSNLTNRDMTRPFVNTYGHMLLAHVDHQTVSEWLLAGGSSSAAKFLRTMFSDAMSVRAGRLLSSNPFSGVVVPSRGNADQDPPSIETVWRLIEAARELAPPGFAAWLQVACFTGMRTCELDGLSWDRVDLEAGWIIVDREFCSRSMTFQKPKNGKPRRVPIHPPAHEVLVALPREAEWVFVNTQRGHWRRSARQWYWDQVRVRVGFTGSLYLATRHFYGSFAVNELRLPFEDVAAALGHTDRGMLCRALYGHFDDDRALERVKEAFRRAA
jgi:integrase